MRILVKDIQREVARRYRIKPAHMREPDARGSRKKRVARARQVAIRLSVLMTEHSLVRIGMFFGGRDHSTIIHACKVVEERRRKDPRISKRLRDITLELLRQ